MKRISTREVRELQTTRPHAMWHEGASRIPSFVDGRYKRYWPKGKSYVISIVTGDIYCITKEFWDRMIAKDVGTK